MLVGYACVFAHDRDRESQIGALRDAGCEQIFSDRPPGARGHRPELAAALDYMRPCDTLVVWKLDRLANSLRQLVETVEAIEAARVGFRSLTETIDTAAPGGSLVFNMFAALAGFERSNARERALAGLDAARVQGRTGGRPAKFGPPERAAAEVMLADPENRISDVAAGLGVSVSTLYRHFPGARTHSLLNRFEPLAAEDRDLMVRYLTNLGTVGDAVPRPMSAVIGRFVLETRWSIPEDLRHTTKWRKGLHAAVTTGRNHEPQRLSMLLDWLWTAALPLCQPVAGRWGCGGHWREMVSRRTVETCREAARALDEAGGRDSRAASQAALAAHSMFRALNELAIRPHSHELAASHIADAASRAVTASTYARPDRAVLLAWRRIKVLNLLQRLVEAGQRPDGP